MQRKRAHSRSHPAHCGSCDLDFVTAVEMVDFVDEGLFLIRLRCSNCADERVAELEDAELEQLENAHLDAQASMIEDIAVLQQMVGEPGNPGSLAA